MGTQVDEAATVVLVSGDRQLVQEVGGLAGAAGVRLDVVERWSARRRWPDGLVLVGGDQATELGGQGLLRPRVVVVGLESGTAVRGLSAQETWQFAVALGAEQVALLPTARDWLALRLARVADRDRRAPVVAVLGGCGGAGASLFATALAVAAADEGRRVALVDLDPLGGGLDVVAAVDDVPGLRWPDLAGERGRLPAHGLQEALPHRGSLAVLACGRGAPTELPGAAVPVVLDAAARGHDLAVLDVPRQLDAVVEDAVRRSDHVLLVVPCRLRAVVAARQVLQQLGQHGARAQIVARRSPGDRWSARRVADALDLPLLAQLRNDPQVETALAHGQLPATGRRSPARRAAEQCLAALVGRPGDRAAVATADVA